jgi:hypothetical protein
LPPTTSTSCRRSATPDFNYIIQGVTPGWDDIYQWYLPRQYIDVDGLTSGDYVLETIADPDSKLVESNENNNCGTVLIVQRAQFPALMCRLSVDKLV